MHLYQCPGPEIYVKLDDRKKLAACVLKVCACVMFCCCLLLFYMLPGAPLVERNLFFSLSS